MVSLCGFRLFLCGGSGSLSGFGGTSGLDGGDDCGLGVENLEVVVLEGADLDYLAEAKGGDVDFEAVWEVCREALDVELTHLDLELTAGLDALGVACDGEGHTDGYWFVVENLEEVDVEDFFRDGVELDVLEDCLHLDSVDGEVDDVDIRCVDEATEVVGRHEKAISFSPP